MREDEHIEAVIEFSTLDQTDRFCKCFNHTYRKAMKVTVFPENIHTLLPRLLDEYVVKTVKIYVRRVRNYDPSEML